jgi:WD40 repeat protein
VRMSTALAGSALVALLASCGSPTAAPSSTPAAASTSAAPVQSQPAGLTLKEIATQPVTDNNVEALAFSPDGKQLAVGLADGTVAIFLLQASAAEDPVRSSKLHTRLVSSLAWSPDGTRIASASADGSVRVWNPQSFQVSRSFNGYPATYPAAVWSPDGQQIAVAQGRDFIQIFDANTDGDPQTMNLPGTTRPLLWLPSGELVAGDLKGKVAFFQPGKPDPVRAYEPATPQKMVASLSLSPSDGSLAVGYDSGMIVLLDPATAKEKSVVRQGKSVNSAAWAPNGKMLAVSSMEFAVTFYDPSGKQLAKQDIGYDMNGVSWSPDGRFVAAGSDDRTFKIWEVSPPQTPTRQAPTPPNYIGR